jgi:hypothetical protein
MIRLPVPAWAGVACLFLTTILLSACGGGPGSMPSCNPDEMSAPLLLAPGDDESTWSASSLAEREDQNPPQFRWLYLGSCAPDDYRIIVSRIPAMPYGDFAYIDAVVLDTRTTGSGDSIGPTIVYEDGSTAVPFSWTPSDPFGPGTYYWRVIPYSSSIHGDYSNWMVFRIGPLCPHPDGYLAPRLVYPRYGQTLPGRMVRFMWLDDNACVIAGLFNVEVSAYSYFPEEDTIVMLVGTTWTRFTIGLFPCTRFYWRVKTTFHDGTAGPVSDVFYFNTSNIDGTSCTPLEALPPLPTSSAPLARMLEPTNCRSGPTTEYPVLDILVEGAQLPIQGRNRAGDSWLVEDANISHTCWVHGSMVEVIGDTSLVMIVDPDPPPTAVPEPSDTAPFNCAQYNANLCSSHPQCILEGGICKNKP